MNTVSLGQPSTSSSSYNIPGDDYPTRTKRRYGASCELCRKRKRKCPGRDSEGNSLCTHCREVGVKCVFPPSRAKVAMASQSIGNVEVDGLRRYIRKLAKSTPEQREMMLTKWAQDDEKKVALGRRKVMQRLINEEAGIPYEDEDEQPELRNQASTSSLRNRPNKRTRRESESSYEESDRDRDREMMRGDHEDDIDEEYPSSSASDLSALRLSLKPEDPPPSELEFSEASDHGEDGEDVDYDSHQRSPYQQHPSYPHQNPAGTGQRHPYPQFPASYSAAPIPQIRTPVPHAQVSAWTDYLINVTFVNSNIPNVNEEEREVLLKNYFNKYVNEFLLWTVYAHTARHVPSLQSNVFSYAAKAHILLAGEMSRPSSIPTVQGLLLLSANNAARGMYAQAWHMTASAVAMIVDLGIHHDGESSKDKSREPKDTPSPESTSSSGRRKEKERDRGDGGKDRERGAKGYVARQMRLRVFWGAFIWDKLLSLALNRTPLLSLELHRPPLPDPVPSTKLWAPYIPPYIPVSSRSVPEEHQPGQDETPPLKEVPPLLHSFTPQLGHEEKCFYESCRANIFLDEVHRFLYRKPWRRLQPWHVRDSVMGMRDRMLGWLKIADRDVVFSDLSRLGGVGGQGCPPPPHILQLNILIRIIWILLYRPFYYNKASASGAGDANTISTPGSSTSHHGQGTSTSTSTSTSTPTSTSSSSSSSYAITHAVTTCEQASVEINLLFKSYASAFPLAKASYAIVFAAFLAATIDLVVIERRFQGSDKWKERDEVLERLRLSQVVLKGGRGSIPGMQESMERLEKRLERVMRAEEEIRVTTNANGNGHGTGTDDVNMNVDTFEDGGASAGVGYTTMGTGHVPQNQMQLSYSSERQQEQIHTSPSSQRPPRMHGASNIHHSVPMAMSPQHRLTERKSLPTMSLAIPESQAYGSLPSANPLMTQSPLPPSATISSSVWQYPAASQHYSQPPAATSPQQQQQHQHQHPQQTYPQTHSQSHGQMHDPNHAQSYGSPSSSSFSGYGHNFNYTSSSFAGIGGVSMPDEGWNAWFWPGDGNTGSYGSSSLGGALGHEPQAHSQVHGQGQGGGGESAGYSGGGGGATVGAGGWMM
ncbi:hypothetical protein AAF712_007998 [Marasmius tenuissimus]|uniref:Zn(2)-C6 fungal-type domain-containing protein n=1 Tax=Marasmius tenuissimus TaxID=585030 RepID=A0ABR2ZTU9_9AGAR